MNNTLFKELSNNQKLIAFILLLICSSILVTTIGLEVVNLLLGTNFNINNRDAYIDNDSIRGLKIITLFSHLGTFIIPSILFLTFLKSFDKRFWELKKIRKLLYLIIPVLFIGISILSEWSLLLNHQIDFSLISENIANYISDSQKNSELLITRFIGPTWLSLIGNTFIIALIPAIGEELTFRGVLQPLFINLSNKKNVSILFVAFIFAFIHFQFMDFIPRFLLGIIYGYIFYFTKNIFYTIILHFLNNFIALIILFINVKYGIEIGSVFTPYAFTLLIGIGLTWYGFKLLQKKGVLNE